jgi:hypothetical protein
MVTITSGMTVGEGSEYFLTGTLTDPGADMLDLNVFWDDGERLHHIPVVHTASSVEVDPPEAFRRALEYLSSTTVVRAVGEA